MKAVVPDETEQDHYPFSGDETVLIKWNELYCDDIKVCNLQLCSVHISQEKGLQLHKVNYIIFNLYYRQ